MYQARTYFVFLAVIATTAQLTIYNLYKGSWVHFNGRSALGIGVLYSHGRSLWCQSSAPTLAPDKTFTMDDVREKCVPKDVLESITYDLNDTTSKLGKFNWSKITKQDLKKFDGEANVFMEKYGKQCEASIPDVVWTQEEKNAGVKLCPCVPPNLRK